ncbi:hypothetical protein EYM_03815 [Ignicoccus islandicus DSM 13165]|uniref:Amino acid permease n=1 Tax=Ignicoccus islandicus DSM 13165 TaxID=940295 RepID=A0A0U3E8K2_9CREN|nr:APC family permease [Ignicoccus islandicus]ALU11694.1 hypothetical protein EYM_03815 [Ignicoccus islandicus DSM 13165]
MEKQEKLSLIDAVALGVGIIIGASIFSLIGVDIQIAGRNLPEAFLLSGIVALGIAYSYAKLGTIITSNAGPIEYALHAFGDNVFIGFLATIYWISYVVSIALFAFTFSSYLLGALGLEKNWLLHSVTNATIISIFTALNFKGAKSVGNAETVLVFLKLFILFLLITAGLVALKVEKLVPDLSQEGLRKLVTAATLTLLSYAGFGVITNASENIENPKRNVPLAIYLSLLISLIVYLLISIVAVGATEIGNVVKYKDYALAVIARPLLGDLGFYLVSFGALVSTLSALNSALYGGANVAYALAKKGELPRVFERKVWFGEPEGLFITAILGFLLSVSLNIEGIAELTTFSIIIVYLAVIASHWKLRKYTNGNSFIISLSIIAVSLMSANLLYYTYITNEKAFWTSVVAILASVAFEIVYRGFTGRGFSKRASEWYRRARGIRKSNHKSS